MCGMGADGLDQAGEAERKHAGRLYHSQVAEKKAKNLVLRPLLAGRDIHERDETNGWPDPDHRARSKNRRGYEYVGIRYPAGAGEAAGKIVSTERVKLFGRRRSAYLYFNM